MIRLITACVLTVLSSACVTTPEYQPASQTALAKLNLNAVGEAWMCSQNKKYLLKPDTSGYVRVPAGDRIIIGKTYMASGYNVTYNCNPSVSFIPEKGLSYFGNFEIANEICRVEIYQEGAKNRVGLALVKSMAAPNICQD